jgi:hypothetical protein
MVKFIKEQSDLKTSNDPSKIKKKKKKKKVRGSL